VACEFQIRFVKDGGGMNVVDRFLLRGDFEREMYCAGLRTELFAQTMEEEKRLNKCI
jgi:hypothetical protein